MFVFFFHIPIMEFEKVSDFNIYFLLQSFEFYFIKIFKWMNCAFSNKFSNYCIKINKILKYNSKKLRISKFNVKRLLNFFFWKCFILKTKIHPQKLIFSTLHIGNFLLNQGCILGVEIRGKIAISTSESHLS